MSDFGKQLLIFLLSWIPAVILTVFFAMLLPKCCNGTGGAVVEAEARDTIVVRDTFIVHEPVASDSVVVRYVTQVLPVVRRDTIIDTLSITTTDSVLVEVPITSKVYEDSTYKAYVSGYMPSLDSIYIYNNERTITIRKQRYKHKIFGIGIQAGYGYTIHGFSPYIGAGISINLPISF